MFESTEERSDSFASKNSTLETIADILQKWEKYSLKELLR
jgi:hypothetical protein